MKLFSPIVLGTIFCLSLQAETTEQVIQLARSQLGPEKKLNAVQTLRYEGTVENEDGSQGKLTLVFKRPYKQYLQLKYDNITETTAVNGYEGWREHINKEQPRRSGVLVLPPNQVQFLIANALENLYFFNGPKEINGGSVTLLGSEERDGVACWKVEFSYPSGLSYTRLFAKDSGKLIITTTSNSDMEMIEKESLVSDGIKFPEIVETYRDGSLVRSVTFAKVEVNPEVDESLFDFPSIPPVPRP